MLFVPLRRWLVPHTAWKCVAIMGSHVPLLRVSYRPYALVLALCYAFMRLTFLQHSMFCYALVFSSFGRVDSRMIIEVSPEDVARSVARRSVVFGTPQDDITNTSKTIVYIFHYTASQTTLHIYKRQTSSWSKLEKNIYKSEAHQRKHGHNSCKHTW